MDTSVLAARTIFIHSRARKFTKMNCVLSIINLSTDCLYDFFFFFSFFVSSAGKNDSGRHSERGKNQNFSPGHNNAMLQPICCYYAFAQLKSCEGNGHECSVQTVWSPLDSKYNSK